MAKCSQIYRHRPIKNTCWIKEDADEKRKKAIVWKQVRISIDDITSFCRAPYSLVAKVECPEAANRPIYVKKFSDLDMTVMGYRRSVREVIEMHTALKGLS